MHGSGGDKESEMGFDLRRRGRESGLVAKSFAEPVATFSEHRREYSLNAVGYGAYSGS